MECPTVDELNVPLKLSEDFNRENIISLSLYEISKYLQEKPSEINESTAYNQSIVLATLTELCCDIKDPGDAFVYVKILNLLILVRKYLAECPGIPSKPAEDSLHQKARDIHTALIQLRSHFFGRMIARIDELIAEAQCQVVLSGIVCEDIASAQHFFDAFITAPVQMPKQLSSQLQDMLAFMSSASQEEEAGVELSLLLTQHSPLLLYNMTSRFVMANLPNLFHRSPMYQHMKTFMDSEEGPQHFQEMRERDRSGRMEHSSPPPEILPNDSEPASDTAASEEAPSKVSKIALKVPRVVLSSGFSEAFWEQRRKTFIVNLNRQRKGRFRLRAKGPLASAASKRGRRLLLSSDEDESTTTAEEECKGGEQRGGSSDEQRGSLSDKQRGRSSDEQRDGSSDEQGNREDATIRRRVRRRSVENVTTRKTVVEVSDEIYDFSDEEERTPASKLPGRLPALKIRPYQDFAPRPRPAPRPHNPKPTPTRHKQANGVRFSEEETRYLKEGMKKFGTGAWKKILDAYPFHSSRTSTSLKDRARNMNGRKQ